MIFRTSADALVGSLQALLAKGEMVHVRGQNTRELLHQSFTITHPLERAISVSARHNNVFASIAETMWVLAGRDDVAYLQPYLPRAIDFSDDGVTWRGAYGPRLRNWKGVDQIEQIVGLLKGSPSSRRAVAMIFDPARDFHPSLDIPCTNWLSFVIRDGWLEMAVTVRSNDIIWGFSGINSFEWSVLHEMVATWTGTEVGSVTYFVASLHLYERHFDRAERILGSFAPTPSHHASIQFDTPLDQLDQRLADWFVLEERIRVAGAPIAEIDAFPDPLLRDFLRMLQAYWSHRRNDASNRALAISHVADEGLAASAGSYFGWQDGHEVDEQVLTRRTAGTEVAEAISRLHTDKDRVYGDSWQKRGELMSILPNLARKVDRLVLGRESLSPAVEDLLDTTADLFVYAVKYKAFLLDESDKRPPQGTTSWAEGTSGVDHIISTLAWNFAEDNDSTLPQISLLLDEVYQSIANVESSGARLPLANELVLQTQALLLATINSSPSITMSIVRSWSG